MRCLGHSILSFATLVFGLLLVPCAPATSWGQDEGASAGVVKFESDVKPILEQRCFRCHGGKTTEGLDLNDASALGDYLVAGEPSESDFYLRLVADEETIMPPIGEGGPLPGSEIATIKLWIEEGANWPEGSKLGAASGEPVATEPQLPADFVPYAERSLPQKLWAIHGWFHPAVVHFPIALFTVGALFVVFNGLFKGNFRELAFWCLLIGTLGAIASCTMGWAFATEKSAGGEEVFWHRWGGIIVAAWSTVVTILALRLKSSDKGLSQAAWQGGLLLSAAMVGLVGHQGGELVYGEHMYQRAFEKYFPSDAPAATEPAPTDETPATTDGEGTTEPAASDSTSTTDSDASSSGSSDTDASEPTPSGVSAEAQVPDPAPATEPSTDPAQTPSTPETPGTETPSTETPATEPSGEPTGGSGDQ